MSLRTNDYFWMLKDSIDKIRLTLLKCLAIFLVWFTTIAAIGLAIIFCIKVIESVF